MMFEPACHLIVFCIVMQTCLKIDVGDTIHVRQKFSGGSAGSKIVKNDLKASKMT